MISSKTKMNTSVFIFCICCLFYITPGQSQNEDNQGIKDQDWPNLKRYEKQNEEIINLKKFPKAVFMGNSITEGWRNTDPDFFRDNNFEGRGISGQTTPQMLLRFTQDVIDLRPEVVVILAGTNDLAGNTGFSTVKMITDNIKAMAQLAVANDIKVILSSILPVYSYPWRKDLKPVSTIREINTWLENYALQNGHVYLDYFSVMADEKKGLKIEYSGDGVHPNEKGYEVMKPMVLNAVNMLIPTDHTLKNR